MQRELASDREKVLKRFGWFFLAKDCADYANCSYFDIMERSALDVAGLKLIIEAKVATLKN